MTDVDAITGVPSVSDTGDFVQQENDLEVGTMKQSLTPHENESSLNRESTGSSGSEGQQTDLDTINPWSELVSEPGLSRDSELGPDGDLDAEVVVPTRTTGTDSLIGVETNTHVTNDQAGVIDEQSTASMGSTGLPETPIETVNHQQPISPPASKIAIAQEEENLAKVGNSKVADSENENACRTSPEEGEISPSNNGLDCSPDSLAPSHSTDAAVPPEDPNPSPRSQVEHKLTKADHSQPVVSARVVDSGVDNSSECVPPSLPTVATVVAPLKHSTSSRGAQVEKSLTNADDCQPASTNNGKPLDSHGQTEDFRHCSSLHGVQGDVGVDNSSECVPPSHPAVAIALAKPCSVSRRAPMEKSLTNADHLQPVGTKTAKPVNYQGQTEDVGNKNGMRADSGVGDSSENAPPLSPPVAGVVAQTKHLSRREKKPSNADQPAGTDTAKLLEYQGQPEDVGNNNSSHSVRGVLGAENSFECVSPSNPIVGVSPAEHFNPGRREKKLTTANPLQPPSTDNDKSLEGQGQSEYFGHYESLHDSEVDLGMDDFSKCVTVAGAPAKHRSSKSRAQLEKKLSNAHHLQPAGTQNAKPVETQGQGLQALSTGGIGHSNSFYDAQEDGGVDKSSDCAPPIFSVPRKRANLSRGPQAEQKPTTADCYQLAGSNKDKRPEDQGQGLQQGHRREGVGHMTSLHSMQGDSARILKPKSTSPQNFQQSSAAGARSGEYQTSQSGYLRTSSISEHVQPQRPQARTKNLKLDPYDGERQLVPITQHRTEDLKPANKKVQVSNWHYNCILAWEDNNRLEREVDSYKNQIQELTLELKQAQENAVLLSKQISKYEQQHAQEIHKSGSYLDDSKAATPALLVSALNGVKDASNNFAKVFKAQVDSSPSTRQASVKQYLSQDIGQVSRIGHIKFRYQAYICKRLFEGFDHRNFGIFESTPGLPVTTVEHCFRQYQMHDFKKSDTVERLFQRHPEIDNFLHEYCLRKFSVIFNRQLEEQLFDGNHEHNDSIDKYQHPFNSRFYRSYCKLAVSIWLVHRLAFSFKQPAKLFHPRPGMRFNTSNMQSVVPLDSASDDEDIPLQVGFCVIPGMKVGESIVPSEVYVFGQ